MKDRALLHLLLAAGRSVEQLEPGRAHDVANICATLQVTRIGRGRFEATWIENGRTIRHDIDGTHFTMYRRGDLPRITAQRPDGLDDRDANWTAAHRVWADVLAISADRLRPPSRTFILAANPSRDRLDTLRNADRAPLVFAAALTALAWAGAPAALPAGALVGAAASTFDDPRRGRSSALVGATLGAAAVTLTRSAWQLDLDAATLGGVGLCVATSRVAAAIGRSGTRARLGVAAGVAIAAAALPVAGTPWLFAASVLLLADLAAGMLRRSSGQPVRLALAATLVAGFGSSLKIAVDSATLATAIAAPPLTPLAPLVPALATALGLAMVLRCGATALLGTRDRLSGWLAGGLFGLGLVIAPWATPPIDASLITSGLCITLAACGADLFEGLHRRQQRTTTARPVSSHLDPPAPIVNEATPVTIGSKRDRLDV